MRQALTRRPCPSRPGPSPLRGPRKHAEERVSGGLGVGEAGLDDSVRLISRNAGSASCLFRGRVGRRVDGSRPADESDGTRACCGAISIARPPRSDVQKPVECVGGRRSVTGVAVGLSHRRRSGEERVGGAARLAYGPARPLGVVIGKTGSGCEPFGDTAPSQVDASRRTFSHSVNLVDGSRGDSEGTRRSGFIGWCDSDSAKKSVNSVGGGRCVASTGAGGADQAGSAEERVGGGHGVREAELEHSALVGSRPVDSRLDPLRGTADRTDVFRRALSQPIHYVDRGRCARNHTGRCTGDQASSRGYAVAHSRRCAAHGGVNKRGAARASRGSAWRNGRVRERGCGPARARQRRVASAGGGDRL
jgi:hypothetical protein